MRLESVPFQFVSPSSVRLSDSRRDFPFSPAKSLSNGEIDSEPDNPGHSALAREDSYLGHSGQDSYSFLLAKNVSFRERWRREKSELESILPYLQCS